MKNDLLEMIKNTIVKVFQDRYGYCGIAENDDMGMVILNSGHDENIVITIEADRTQPGGLEPALRSLWAASKSPVLVILDAEGKETARCREIGDENVWLYHTAEGYQIFNDQQPCKKFNGVKYADLEVEK